MPYEGYPDASFTLLTEILSVERLFGQREIETLLRGAQLDMDRFAIAQKAELLDQPCATTCDTMVRALLDDRRPDCRSLRSEHGHGCFPADVS